MCVDSSAEPRGVHLKLSSKRFSETSDPWATFRNVDLIYTCGPYSWDISEQFVPHRNKNKEIGPYS